MRTKILKLLLSIALILFGTNSYSQFQPMGIAIGSYVLEANAAKDITAFCLRESLSSPRAGISYQSIGFGADNAFIVTSKGKFSVNEALEKGMIEITGTSSEDGYGQHDRLRFKNNTGEDIKFEVTDDFVLKTKDDNYTHVANVLNKFKTNDEMWEALAPFEKLQRQNDILKEINKNSPNQILKVTYINDGTSVKYKIENGQKEAIYSGNNFKEIAEITNSTSSKKQHFILEEFPNKDKENGFLRSVEIANQKTTGYKAIEFPKENLNIADILFENNPRLVKTYPIEEAFLSDYKYSISADVEINNLEYEVIAEANKKGLLSTWITNIKSFFGVRSNNLNDILNNANKTIRRVYPNDKYGVTVDYIDFSFTIRLKKVENDLAKL
ncbi:MAG: hypothetical protein HEQ40_10745 [Lacibacter sp.]|jgi:uncharacterized pyridoxamine 5'-phosphate oxidase family protein